MLEYHLNNGIIVCKILKILLYNDEQVFYFKYFFIQVAIQDTRGYTKIRIRKKVD